MSRLLTGIFIAILWLLHWLPLALLASLGRTLGGLLYAVAGRRRRITLVNLKLCFPDHTEAERTRLAKEHFALLGRSLLERGLAWWASPARLHQLARVEGLEHITSLNGRRSDAPIIFLVPHFLGFDLGGTRTSLDLDMLTMYSPQKPPAIDALILKGRSRFGEQFLVTRQDGIRPLVKAIRTGHPFYYLPDMDYGMRDAVFVPFFGTDAATITGLSRLAKLTGATVHECVSEILPGSQGYVTRISPAWDNFPSDDLEADTRRMNAVIEANVLRMPAQYYWVHKRFKTRPAGEKSFY